MIGENCYYEDTSNIKLLQNYLTKNNINLSLIDKTEYYINKKINKIMEQKIVIRVPYDKKFLIGKAINYNESKSCPFVLLSKSNFLT